MPLISAQNCDKNALQNRRGRPVLNKIGSLTVVFSVFSFAKICQCMVAWGMTAPLRENGIFDIMGSR